MNRQGNCLQAKRSIVREQLLQMPERSNRYIAKHIGVSDKIVGAVRKDLESRAEIPTISHTIGQDGRRQVCVRTRLTSNSTADSDFSSPTERMLSAQTIERFVSRSSGDAVSRQPVKGTEPVLTQVRIALARGNTFAICFGLLLGGFVPVAAWSVMHLEKMEWWHLILIAGGSLFSALTVVDWGTIVFQNPAKALGFAVLVEGVMLGSQIPWLSILALCLLVVINGVNSAVNLMREIGEGSARKSKNGV